MTDLADRAIDTEERHRAAALAAQQDRRQRQQRSAMLTRAAARTHCADCGDPIPPLRLVAVPHATRCAHCQHIAERQHVV